jgi:hypothetical protein
MKEGGGEDGIRKLPLLLGRIEAAISISSVRRLRGTQTNRLPSLPLKRL